MKALISDMDFRTRRSRRDAMVPLIACLTSIRNAEQKSLDNTPENFQDSESFEIGECAVETLDEIISLLSDVY